MLEIIHIRGNTFCIDTGMTYIPFYKVNESDIILLDSGWATGERAKLVELFDANQFNIVAIINSHSHIDHSGNNAYFKEKYHCTIAMSAFDAHVCSSINNLKLYYNRYTLSGIKEHYGHLVCETDLLIEEFQQKVYINGVKFKTFQTPGHSPSHICIVTPDDVAYLGDALITDKVMKSAKLPYAYILEEDLKSKAKLLDLNAHSYVIAHKGIVNDITDLVHENIAFYSGRADKLLALITSPMTTEDILKVIVKEWHISIRSTNKYKFVERMLRSYIEYLCETNKLKLIIEDGFLKYQKYV